MSKDFIDVNGVIQSITEREVVILELGCGPNRRIANSICIDILPIEGVDIIADLNQGLHFIPSNSVDYIYSYHFLEHLSDVSSFIKEIHRVLKFGGKTIGKVPHSVNPYFFSDPTHKSFFGLYTFCYFSKDHKFKRKVPNFYNSVDFEIAVNKIIFFSEFPIRHFFKKVFQKIFNSSTWTLEFYEEHLVYLIPPYEIYFELIKRDSR